VRQPFARTRVSLTCHARMLDREEAAGRAMLEAMEESFGSIVPLLGGLPDFHLFTLTPTAGRFVAGFGRAFRLDGLRVVEHLGR
ncbi:MAG: HugZ family protein, partial [Halothiobacillaceae bacterium]